MAGEDHRTLDDALFKQLAGDYSEHNPAMTNRFIICLIITYIFIMNSSACLKYPWLGPVTNGAQWYPKNGTLKDFSYQQTNSLALVIELSCCKFLRSYFLPREWDNNRQEESCGIYLLDIHYK